MNKAIEKIKKLELPFSSNNYNGAGENPFIIEKGNIPIMISAPHSVNRFRNGEKRFADMYTGSIAKYLKEKTGCHIIYSCMYTETDANYDPPEINEYQKTLKEYVEDNNIKLLIDLHGSARKREYAVEIGTAQKNNDAEDEKYEEDPSLHGYKFIAKIIKEKMEKILKNAMSDRKKYGKM